MPFPVHNMPRLVKSNLKFCYTCPIYRYIRLTRLISNRVCLSFIATENNYVSSIIIMHKSNGTFYQILIYKYKVLGNLSVS